MRPSNRPTAIDLFAGAGGTGLGLIQAKFNILAAVELDTYAAATYAKNLGVEVLQKDIRSLSPSALRRQLVLRKCELSLLAGCPPCQGFSRMRNANGAGDQRNDLVLRYLDYVDEFRPQFAVFENVPGLIRTKHGRAYYESLLSGFRELGYRYTESVVDAADFGVAQHRSRVIVIARRGRCPSPALKPTHGAPDDPDVILGRLKPWRTVREVLSTYPSPDSPRAQRIPNHRTARIGSRNGGRVLEFIRRVPPDGGGRLDVPRKYWLPCHLEHTGHRDVYGRMYWDRPANTITSGCINPSKGRFVHPEEHRGLTYREAAALQGFPDTFEFQGGWVDAQIGNAVPPPLAFAIARAVLHAMAV